MKHICQFIALIIIFSTLTTPTPCHLSPVLCFLAKVGYNVLTVLFWAFILVLSRKIWHSNCKDPSGLFPIVGKWLSAIVIAFLFFGLALAVKQFAYGHCQSANCRPMFAYGWPFPWKWETHDETFIFPWIMATNAWCCFGLALFLCGFRKLKSLVVVFLLSLLLSIGVVSLTGNATRACNFLFSSNHVKANFTNVEGCRLHASYDFDGNP